MAVDVINANLPIDGGGTGPVTLNFAPQGYLSFPGGAGSPVPTINLTSTTNQTFVTIGYVNQWAAQWAADPNNPLRGESVSFGAVAPLQISGGNILLTPGTAEDQVLTWNGSAWAAQAPTGGPGGGIPEPTQTTGIFGRGGTTNQTWQAVVPVTGGLDLLANASGTDAGFLLRQNGAWRTTPVSFLTGPGGVQLVDDNNQPLVFASGIAISGDIGIPVGGGTATVQGLQGRAVLTTPAPSIGDGLVWTAGGWAPGPVQAGAMTADNVSVSPILHDGESLGAMDVQEALRRLFVLIQEGDPGEPQTPEPVSITEYWTTTLQLPAHPEAATIIYYNCTHLGEVTRFVMSVTTAAPYASNVNVGMGPTATGDAPWGNKTWTDWSFAQGGVYVNQLHTDYDLTQLLQSTQLEAGMSIGCFLGYFGGSGGPAQSAGSVTLEIEFIT